MNTDDERPPSRPDQANMRCDDAPERFRSGHSADQFSGASGVLFEQAMAQTRMAICLCDPNQPDLPIVFRAVAMAGMLAFAVGTMNAFLFLAFPAWERVWTIATRPLFIISGVFFLFEDVPADIRDIFWFNPLFHVTGEMRRAFYATYDASYVSPTYTFGLGFGLLGLGLLLLTRHGDGMLHK